MLEIKTEKFQGPLSLLLELIEKEELDITEVSLAKIADQYVNYIKESGDINPDDIADFLVMAAKLLYIKSKALLPYLYSDEDEEVGELEQQLKMYKELIEYKISIEDKILSIQQALMNKIKISFNKILYNSKSKTEIIVSFLAMLELVKQRDIAVKQEGLFREIIINKA